MTFLYSSPEEKKGGHMISNRAHFSGKTATLMIALLPPISLAYFLIFHGMHYSIVSILTLLYLTGKSCFCFTMKLFVWWVIIIIWIATYWRNRGNVKVAADMHQRKAEMAKRSDAFIALTGSYYYNITFMLPSLFLLYLNYILQLTLHVILEIQG